MSTRHRSAPGRSSAFAQRNLPLLLLHARESVIARFRPILNAHGLTEQQWRVLRALLEAGPLEPREIVTLCRISSPSLAGVLARMDDQGLVTRERFEDDLRRVLVTPTPRSRALAQKMAPRIEAVYAELQQQLGRADYQRFVASLDAVIARLGVTDTGEPE